LARNPDREKERSPSRWAGEHLGPTFWVTPSIGTHSRRASPKTGVTLSSGTAPLRNVHGLGDSLCGFQSPQHGRTALSCQCVLPRTLPTQSRTGTTPAPDWTNYVLSTYNNRVVRGISLSVGHRLTSPRLIGRIVMSTVARFRPSPLPICGRASVGRLSVLSV
jgi:hypothetical protein